MMHRKTGALALAAVLCAACASAAFAAAPNDFGPPQTLADSFPPTMAPVGLSCDGNGGALLFGLGANASVLHLDLTTSKVTTVAANLARNGGSLLPPALVAARDTTGTVYAALASSLVRIVVGSAVTSLGNYSWMAIATDMKGNLYGVPSETPDSVVKLTPGGTLSTVINSTSGVHVVRSLVVDNTSTLFLTDVTSGNTSRVLAWHGGGPLAVVMDNLGVPAFGNTLAADSLGFVYSLQASGGIAMAKSASTAGAWDEAASVAPWSSGISADADGNLIVAEPNKIVKLARTT